MTTNPTPPPWHARLSPNHDHHIESANNVVLAKIYAHPTESEPAYGTVPAPEGQANARAIVQAINTREIMLRALLLALSHLQPHGACQLLRTQAEACDIVAEAIRAATKEQP